MTSVNTFQRLVIRVGFLSATASFLAGFTSISVRADRLDDFDTLNAEFETAREKYLAAIPDKEPTSAEHIRNYDEWPVWDYIPQFLALAEINPSDDTAFQCCQWIFDRAGSFPGDSIQFAAEQKAWPIVAAHHATGDRVPKLCLEAAQSAGPPREQFLRDLLKQPSISNEHAGYATLALAELLIKRIELAEFYQETRKSPADDVLVNHLQSRFAPDYVEYLSNTKIDACKAEIAQLLQAVIDRYGEVSNTVSMAHFRDMATLGDKAKKSLHAIEHLYVGAEAPDIVGKDLDGNILKLRDFRGRVVLLSFWSSGCGPCIEILPKEKELVEEFKDRPFALLAVCADEDLERGRAAAKEHGINWPCWFDGDNGPIAQDYNILGWPTFCLLDENGRIVSTNLDREHMDVAIEKLLNNTTSP